MTVQALTNKGTLNANQYGPWILFKTTIHTYKP